MAIAKKAPPVNNPLKAQKAPTTASGKKTKKAIAGHTGGGMKLPERKPRGKRPTPKVSDTGGGLRRPKKMIRSGGDGLTPVRRRRAISRSRTAMARAGNRSRRGLRR